MLQRVQTSTGLRAFTWAFTPTIKLYNPNNSWWIVTSTSKRSCKGKRNSSFTAKNTWMFSWLLVAVARSLSGEQKWSGFLSIFTLICSPQTWKGWEWRVREERKQSITRWEKDTVEVKAAWPMETPIYVMWMGKFEERNGLQTNNWRKLTLILKEEGKERGEERSEDLCNIN